MASRRQYGQEKSALFKPSTRPSLPGMTDITEWRAGVGKAWAQSWQLTDRSFAGLTSRFLDMVHALPGQTILDIGSGAGELSLALARKRIDARVIGVDVSPDLITAAQQRAQGHPSVEFELGDAAIWQRPGFTPDLLVSRHGVMFFDDPVRAFSHLAHISAKKARLAFTCFRAPQENAWISGLAALITGGAPRVDPLAPGPFAFADSQRVSAILTAAGWSGVRIEPLDFAYVAGSGAEAVSDARAFFTRIGPLAAVLRAAEGQAREDLYLRLDHWLGQNCRDGLVAFPAAAWQVTARKG